MSLKEDKGAIDEEVTGTESMLTGLWKEMHFLGSHIQ